MHFYFLQTICLTIDIVTVVGTAWVGKLQKRYVKENFWLWSNWECLLSPFSAIPLPLWKQRFFFFWERKCTSINEFCKRPHSIGAQLVRENTREEVSGIAEHDASARNGKGTVRRRGMRFLRDQLSMHRNALLRPLRRQWSILLLVQFCSSFIYLQNLMEHDALQKEDDAFSLISAFFFFLNLHVESDWTKISHFLQEELQECSVVQRPCWRCHQRAQHFLTKTENSFDALGFLRQGFWWESVEWINLESSESNQSIIKRVSQKKISFSNHHLYADHKYGT
jgi:hypothetical protein